MTHPIAKVLSDARRLSGMSVLELSDRSGYSESMLVKLECGHRTPGRLNTLTAWAEALGYEVTVQRKKSDDYLCYEKWQVGKQK